MASPIREPGAPQLPERLRQLGRSGSRSDRLPNQLPPVQGGPDPWAAFGYLVSGVAVYGAIGYGLGRWLNASYLTAIGIVVGATLALYLVVRQSGLGAPPPAGNVSDHPGYQAPAAHREGRGEPAE